VARAVTAPVQIKDFADWIGCSTKRARLILAAQRCPECGATETADQRPRCTSDWHFRGDSGDWS
jgi:hypothetical protein